VDIELTDLAQILKGKILSQAYPRIQHPRFSTDTRLIEKNDIFFAFKGEKFDGHDFLEEAFDKGARTFIVSDDAKSKHAFLKEANVIKVADTVTAYGDCAAHVRLQFNIPFIAITGSVGKTTAKELVAHFLQASLKVLKNRGTENNLIGVPKTLLQLTSAHEAAVLELGTNAPGEIDRLASVVKPQIGILTQIGYSHLEGLKSLQGVKKEKTSLISHIDRGGLLLLNGEDPEQADIQSGVHKIVRVGFSRPQADVVAEQIWSHENGTTFRLNGQELFETQLIGRHNLIHVLFAIEVSRRLGIEMALMQKCLPSFKSVPGRLQIKKADEIVFIDDSYNSNPTSFEAALETLKNMKVRGRKAVVCGDMLELGERAIELHRKMGKILAQMKLAYIVAAGDLCQYLVDEAIKDGYDAQRIFHVPNSLEAGQIVMKQALPQDVVLIKGSRRMAMEKILNCFSNSSTP
jgi:UDP-N-acetylmuramoyl-tripeptide--D-alanyl-D-alanine ligase